MGNEFKKSKSGGPTVTTPKSYYRSRIIHTTILAQTKLQI